VRVYVEALELAYVNHSAGCYSKPSIMINVTGYNEIGVQKALTYAGALMGSKVYGLQVRYCYRVPDGSCYALVLG
jgi:hypothetical protein